MTILNLLALLLLKHFIVDFPLQRPYHYENKGVYGHAGGLLHAGMHGVGTWFCFAWLFPLTAVYLALFDTLIHYHVDWAKVNINKAFGWGPNNSQFWVLLGLDQLIHCLTYIGLVYILVV